MFNGILIAVLGSVIMTGFGGAVLRVARSPNRSPALGFLVGNITSGTIFFLLGCFRLLTPAGLGFASGFIVVASLGFGMLSARLPSAERIAGETGENLFLLGGIGILVVSAVWLFETVRLPPFGMDALSYHLALPDQFLIRHSVLPIANDFYYLYPLQYEMSLFPLLALEPSGSAAQMWGVFVWLSLIWGAGALGALAASRVSIERKTQSASSSLEAGTAAALLVATLPLFFLLVPLTKNDLFASAAVVWGIAVLWGGGVEQIERPEPRPGYRFLAGLLFGAALASKPTTAFFLLPFVVLVLFRKEEGTSNFQKIGGGKDSRENEENPPRSVLTKGASWRTALTGGTLLLPALWLVRNFLGAGEFLPNLDRTTAFSPHGPLSSMERILRLGQVFLRHFPNPTDGPFGPGAILGLMTCVFAFFRRRKGFSGRVREILGASVTSVVLWVFFGKGIARFLLPALVPLVALGGAVLAPSRFGRTLVLLTSVVSLLWGGILSEREFRVTEYLSGEITKTDFLGEWYDAAALMDSAARLLPRDAKVAAVGEAELFYLHRRARTSGYWEPEFVLEWARSAENPEALRRKLRTSGFTHVLYNRTILRRLVRSGIKPLPSEMSVRRFEEMLSNLPTTVEDPHRGIVIKTLEP
ncbi:MAG: hypothetical protein D6679_01710 [Candidatus Hydrogenedentota bacterium]|nr:MAG: hypothetical protein D6679_01710 [Candidatus Hydrogenedentota bacterium]